MAPAKFQIYVDQSLAQNPPPQVPLPQPQPQPATSKTPEPIRFLPDALPPMTRYYFDERRLYPLDGSELSFEEVNYQRWLQRQQRQAERMQLMHLQQENEDLKRKCEALSNMLVQVQKQTTSRHSIVPQSLQPAQGPEPHDMSVYGIIDVAATGIQDHWEQTEKPIDKFTDKFTYKFTVPIDQSQFIRDNVPTSTPASKKDNKFARPSMGGSPTLKLSPITETSRDCNSKSSSSGSTAIGCTPSTKTHDITVIENVPDEPEQPLNPNEPVTYKRLLSTLLEPLDRRPGFFRLNRSIPKIRKGACFQAGCDNYLVDNDLCPEEGLFTAQLLPDDSNDDMSDDLAIKTVCLRVDQPANEWLFYICDELHRRLVRQKTKPDIELSVMISNPAVMYSDGSILVDEDYRYVTLEHLFEACQHSSKPFPRSVAAYITLELIQLIRQMHTCDIIHMNICPKNIIVSSCPTRDDIASVDLRTAAVKLIGFDRAMDMRLLPPGFKFDMELENLCSCEMLDSRPWNFEVDWFGVISCIHRMFFFEDLKAAKLDGRWAIDREFKGFPTNVWTYMFDELLNIQDMANAAAVIDRATDELSTWIKANISFVLKEADALDRMLDVYLKERANKCRSKV